jgi:nucleotide-binding universal stress UspA family protein
MTFASFMVHVDAGPAAAARVDLAVDLVDRFGGTLIGVAATAPPPPVVESGDMVGSSMVESDLVTVELQEVSARLAQCERVFRSTAGSRNRPVEWRASLEAPTDFVARQARAADLLVIGRDRTSDDLYESLDPGRLLLKAGRPVLIVPADVGALRAERVVVAWKDTRESRRAVHDAIPLLQRAKEVIVVEACDRGDEFEAQKHVEDVATYLLRHRVTVGAKIFVHPRTSVARELIRHAVDEGADLVVAGAYGHSRLGEWMFGGVTRSLLASAPVCCLFAH